MASYINEWIVREYSELVKDQDGVVLLSVESLTVEEAQTLRNEVRETGANLIVGKKRLVRVALKEVGIELADDAWESGSAALLVGDTETTINAAKTIEKIYKKAKMIMDMMKAYDQGEYHTNQNTDNYGYNPYAYWI